MEKPNIPKLPNVGPIQFLKEVRTELGKVTWPTRNETFKLTAVVIVISLVIGAFIGGIDALLTSVTSILFRR